LQSTRAEQAFVAEILTAKIAQWGAVDPRGRNPDRTLMRAGSAFC
jgi:hypothetical protein